MGAYRGEGWESPAVPDKPARDSRPPFEGMTI